MATHDFPDVRRFRVLSFLIGAAVGGAVAVTLAKLPDHPGGLVDFLLEFSKRGINLTKIESRPARIKDSFKYWFLIDFDGHVKDERVQEVIEHNPDTITFLGSYVKLC